LFYIMGHVQELLQRYESYKTDIHGGAEPIKAAVVVAHPDDEIILSNLLAVAKRSGVRLHGITLTRGESTTKNFRRFEDFTPRRGDRADEARKGALRAGCMTHDQLRGTDEGLAHDVPWLAGAVADLLMAHEVDLVFGLSQMGPNDSPDHAAAGNIALRSAQLVSREEERHIGVLTVRPDARGFWYADSSVESMALILAVTIENNSQFRVGLTEDRPYDWFPLAEDYSIHPADWQELQQYPVTRAATHSFVQCGRLLVPQHVEF
jgi:LmbE family N-acetylglucosaminyl deacetylase